MARHADLAAKFASGAARRSLPPPGCIRLRDKEPVAKGGCHRQWTGLACVALRSGLTALKIARIILIAAALQASACAIAQSEAIPAFKQVDSIEARVQGCVTCHGQSGQGTVNGYFPRIAGKPASYLYHQLVAFRDGERRYAPMNYLVAYLPDSYLREIAEHFAKQRPPFSAKESAPADPTTMARGRSLVTGGDPAKGVPACIACHGAGLTGMEPGIPGLVGLRSTYVIAQLTRWRVGERHAIEPDCMKRVATRLTDTDIVAVAAWLGQQSAPADPSPESANLVRMPFACGSQR
jgi:cytochrome c553